MTTVDARGLACPLPLTLAKEGMASVPVGEHLRVLATDPEAAIDLAAWAAEAGHSCREEARDGWREYVLRKGEEPSPPAVT